MFKVLTSPPKLMIKVPKNFFDSSRLMILAIFLPFSEISLGAGEFWFVKSIGSLPFGVKVPWPL